MARCQGRGFIQEEQMGVPAWGHHLTMSAFEFQYAGHPDAVGEGLDDPTLVVVQNAPVPHQGSTGRGGDQFIDGGDAVGVSHFGISNSLRRVPEILPEDRSCELSR